VARARRGDLSGPVLAILVTLILLAIGAAIIAYFTLFAGGTAQPVITVTGQPIAYKSGASTPYDAKVEITVINTGSAQVTLDVAKTKLKITGPSDLVTALTSEEANLDAGLTIAPGSTATLTFTFNGEWDNFAPYRMASAVLTLVDTAGNTVGILEVSIRIVGGG